MAVVCLHVLSIHDSVTTEVPLSQTNLLTFEDQRCPGGHIKAVDDGTHIGHAAVEPSSLDVTEEHGPESPVPPPPSTLLPSRDEGDAEGSTAYPSDQFIKSQPFVERAASQGSSADLHADDGSPAPSLRSILSTSGPDEDAVGTSVVTDPRAAIRDEAGPLAAASATHPASPSVDCGSGSCSVTDVQPSDVQPSASPLATASINHVPDHRSDPPQAPRDHAVTDGREADSNEMGARLDLMDRGTLLAYRAELTLELAWMQQAIASREKVKQLPPSPCEPLREVTRALRLLQYLILKRELLFET